MKTESKSESVYPAKWSALHTAALLGNSNWVEKLIAAGTDPDILDDNGRAPLQWALAMGHCHIVSLLLARGAKARSA